MRHIPFKSRPARLLIGKAPLAPCRLCGSTRPPEVRPTVGLRRMIRCRECGNFVLAETHMRDAEVVELWNARATRDGPRLLERKRAGRRNA